MGNEAVRNLVREGKTPPAPQRRRHRRPGRHADDRDGPRPPRVGRSRLDGDRPVDLGVPGRDPGPGRRRCVRRRRRRPRSPPARARRPVRGSDEQRIDAAARRRSAPADPRSVGARWWPSHSRTSPSAGVTPCPGGWLVLPARLAGVTVIAEEAFVLRNLMRGARLPAEVRVRRRSTPRSGYSTSTGSAVPPVRPSRLARWSAGRALVGIYPIPSRAALRATSRAGGARARAVADPRRLPALQVDARGRARDPAVPPAVASTRRTPTCRSRT